MEPQRFGSLGLPPPEKLREICEKQEATAKEIRERRARELHQGEQQENEEQRLAAEVIQKSYRGYRDRRALKGWGLDPSTRWLEAIKEARYHSVTSPRPRDEEKAVSPNGNYVRHRWRRVGVIAHRAGSDDTSESEGEFTSDEQCARMKEHKRMKKHEREQYARVMGLEYFLEMVDQKHRYGSNLRRYHQEWKRSDTHDNFFYWLDHGEGKHLDLEDRPRKRLDTEQVRYLSREERQRYLVTIDEKGRICWAKDGTLITTSPEFKDSINGIVPVDDKTPSWREVTTGQAPLPGEESSDSDSISGISTGSHVDAAKYSNQELHDAKGWKKVNHLSVDTIMNHLLRKTTKKNTWIFVADTSFRLYMGIKQSGAFQHSSFLHGARVAAAGLIKVKRGQIRKISPLSGHYAPPVRNFREFVKNLKEAGADMSRCNLSRSYAVILGLEGYLEVKKTGKKVERGVKDLLNPEERRKREEEERDKSRSAQKEREVLARRERLQEAPNLHTKLRKKIAKDEDDAARGATPPLPGTSSGRAELEQLKTR